MGLVYAWSIFVPPLAAEFGWDPSKTSMGFTILMSMFCLGGIATGLITKKYPVGLVVFLSALLVGGGFYASSTLQSLAGLYLFFSVMVGLGVGMTYNAVLSSILKWFPDKIGLISGLLMMGFGLGSFILSTVGTSSIQNYGWRATFVRLGIVYFFVILICSFFVRPPGPGVVFKKPSQVKKKAEDGLELPASQMLKRQAFWFFFLWAVVLTAASLMVIGAATPIARSLGADSIKAGFLTGMIAISNGCGRVIAGVLHDKLGRKIVLPIYSVLFTVTGCVLYLAITSQSLTLITVGFLMTGLAYGGIPPSSSTVISRFYGQKNYSLNFSLANTSILAASFLGPALAGQMQSKSQSYGSTFMAIIIFGVLSIAFCFKIRRP
jgi:OFA family oxalate/formate antiporter-like MFS transporter